MKSVPGNLGLREQRWLGHGPLVGSEEQHIRTAGVHLVTLARVNRFLPTGRPGMAESEVFSLLLMVDIPFLLSASQPFEWNQVVIRTIHNWMFSYEIYDNLCIYIYSWTKTHSHHQPTFLLLPPICRPFAPSQSPAHPIPDQRPAVFPLSHWRWDHFWSMATAKRELGKSFVGKALDWFVSVAKNGWNMASFLAVSARAMVSFWVSFWEGCSPRTSPRKIRDVYDFRS